jgi:hypothetical protein
MISLGLGNAPNHIRQVSSRNLSPYEYDAAVFKADCRKCWNQRCYYLRVQLAISKKVVIREKSKPRGVRDAASPQLNGDRLTSSSSVLGESSAVARQGTLLLPLPWPVSASYSNHTAAELESHQPTRHGSAIPRSLGPLSPYSATETPPGPIPYRRASILHQQHACFERT